MDRIRIKERVSVRIQEHRRWPISSFGPGSLWEIANNSMIHRGSRGVFTSSVDEVVRVKKHRLVLNN